MAPTYSLPRHETNCSVSQTFNSIQSIIGFDKAMAEISGKLDAMKVSNDSGENQR
jgi:hypothetical protein